MTRWTVFFTSLLTACLILFGCTGSGDNSVIPGVDDQPITDLDVNGRQSQTHLWGFYDVSIDIDSRTVEAVVNRNAMFTANVVDYINGNPANLSFNIKNTVIGLDYIDVDIDVSITHPFSGLSQYNGYDVRGVFIGSGLANMKYDDDIQYGVLETNQSMLADPNDPLGNEFGKPDGHTRWFNRQEFMISGLFGYTQGLYGTPGYYANATLCPYKYYADDFSPTSFLWPTLIQHQGKRGVFSSGQTNARNYYIRFPNSQGVKFAYAVTANWEAEYVHPSNAPEAIALDLEITDDVWYLDETYNGGELILDMKIWNWNTAPNSVGVMDEYIIHVDSPVLSSVYEFSSSDMTPTIIQTNFCEYHVEIPADHVTSANPRHYWVIIEYPDHDYKNDLGVPNNTGDDPLAAYFQYDLEVADYVINNEPVCNLVIDGDTPVPADDFKPVPITFDATGTYDADVFDTLTYEWDFDGDSIYDEDPDDNYLGDPNHPTHLYYDDIITTVYMRVTDGNTGEDICSVPVDVAAYPSKNLTLRAGVEARDICIDHTNGDLLVAYEDYSIWKYPRSSFYETGSQFINTTGPYWATSPYLIDMAPNQYTMVGGLYFIYNSSFIYNPSGTQLNTYFWLTWQSTACDVIAMGSGGDYANDLCFAHGYIQTGVKHNIARRHADPAYLSYMHHDYSFSEIYYDGYDKIYFDYIVGCESDKNDDLIWVLEDADYFVSRWELSDSPAAWTFDNAYFGTGSQTDSDDGFWFPQDITRDDTNRLFVLDQLSTDDPSVKMWTVNGDDTTSIGSFGDTNVLGDTGCITGAPLRIEGCDFDGKIVVLHGGGSDPYWISVFQPIEMPE